MRLIRLLRQARAFYAMRRQRDTLFGDLFGEPAWDMLLDLFIAMVEGRKMPIKNLCIAACVPTSTALRWVDRLCCAGLIEKQDDAEDGRRSLVRLTTQGWDSVVALLESSIRMSQG